MNIHAKTMRLAESDNINTDVIIAGKYTKTLDYNEMASHLFEDMGPALAGQMKGKVLVAGRNFGCGSSREQAPLALKYGGCCAVVASSFARIFYRNAINIGLPVIIADTDSIAAEENIEIDLLGGKIIVGKDRVVSAAPMPKIMLDIFSAGGMVEYMKAHGSFEM